MCTQRCCVQLRSHDIPKQSTRKSYSPFSSFSTYALSSPSEQQRHQSHIDVSKWLYSPLPPHFLHVGTITWTVPNAREASCIFQLCMSSWSVATMSAHHINKLWCCINDWRCYPVLHLPATDTDVDNRRVTLVRSFPQRALPVYPQGVDERITLRWWLVLQRRRLFTLSEDSTSNHI